MDWISVKDQPAPKDKPFICYDPTQPECSRIYVVQYEPETEFTNEGYIETGGECYFTWQPTHWMPRPQPPKD